MRTTLKRICSLLLCLVMAVEMLPTTAFADSEVHWCFNCDAIYYGDVDDDIYNESEDCCGPGGNSDCWLEIHCWECGEYVDRYWTNDCCMWCRDCIEDQGTHCAECDECYLSNEDQLCGECHKCEICSGGICPECGLCDECATSGDNTHCIICGACAVSADWHDDTSHCLDCCSYCEQCEDNCTADDLTIEYCDECGLCMDCCLENREAFGCDLFCVESSEFEDHFCEECGACWCNTYQCGYCGLCAECCEDNSECEEGMCVEDSDYDDHFCPECNECFHNAEQCDECGLCESCCAAALNDAKASDCSTCDGYSCVEEDGFADHMYAAHGTTIDHTHRFAKGWSMDGTYHWHTCLSCGDGKDAIGSETGGHTLSNGICTTCGYKSGATVYFTVQPEDAHVQVSDPHYSGSYYWANPGPTNYWKNRTSFRGKAFGKGLTYQWHQVKTTGGGVTVDTALTDNTTDKGELYISGAKTPTLTISVSTDSCTAIYSYYCVVTDANGETATSASAQMKASHRYSVAKYAADTEFGSVWLKTYYSGEDGWLNRAQASTGHRWYCCGTGHGSAPVTLNKVAKPHNFELSGTAQGAYTKEALLANNCITFNKYRCTDCYYVKYVEDHECYMLPKQYDPSDENAAKKHQLVCLTGGCDKTGSAFHEWEFYINKWPNGSSNGNVWRKCTKCGYLDSTFTWTAVEKDETTTTKTELSWNTDNILVDVLYGTANCPLVKPGETVILTPELDGKYKFTGWEMRYFYGDTEYTVSLTATKDSTGDTWRCTIPTNFFTANSVPGGGNLYFTGMYASTECTHEGCGTIVTGAKDAVCVYEGYTGDTICAACGGVVTPGTVIPGGTGHTGTLEAVDGEVDVAATCTKDGHKANKRCSACKHIVSGDVITKTGHNRNTVNSKAATCTENGYSGDIVCTNCEKTLSNGHEIAATGHSWDAGVESKKGKLTVITYTCTREGCGATTTRIRRGNDILRDEDKINSINLNMTGYALGKTAGNIKVTADSDTAAKLDIGQCSVHNGIPFNSRNEVNINTKLNNSDSFAEGQTYYLTVQVTPKNGYNFNTALTKEQITLQKTLKAKELRIVTNPVNSERIFVAVFKLQPLYGTYTVTMEGAGNSASGAGSYKTGATVPINAGTKDGFTFNGWTTSDGVTFADATSATTTFTMPNKAVTVTANWEADPTAVSTPTFSPAGGTYTAEQTVEISTTTEGATIYYTTDGSTPTTASAEYAAAITVDGTITLKAIAVKDGMSNSAVASATYTIDSTATTYTVTVQNDGNGTASASAASATEGATITLSHSATTGYHFKEWQVVSGTVTISGNTFTMPASNVTVKAIFEADTPDPDPSVVATPTFSPVGGSYADAQEVTISTATEGATIYYTTDGTAPTAESTEYTGAITVDSTTTIKAIAVKDGMTNSEIATATYTIGTTDPDPDPDPTPGGSDGSGKSGKSSAQKKEENFWRSVEKEIKAADPGEKLDIDTKSYDNVPWYVLEAIRQSGATVTFQWKGESDIVVPAEKAPNVDGQIFYPLADLAALVAKQPAAPVVNPETGGATLDTPLVQTKPAASAQTPAAQAPVVPESQPEEPQRSANGALAAGIAAAAALVAAGVWFVLGRKKGRNDL